MGGYPIGPSEAVNHPSLQAVRPEAVYGPLRAPHEYLMPSESLRIPKNEAVRDPLRNNRGGILKPKGPK